jgi:hypothetical protein
MRGTLGVEVRTEQLGFMVQSRWFAVVNAMVNFRVPYKVANSLTG